MRIGGKLFNFIILYRSPSQSQNDFEAFLKKNQTFGVKVTQHHAKLKKLGQNF